MRLFGHPLHPMLVHFPVAFWSLATILDGCTLAGIQQASLAAWYCLALASIAALPAMATGLFEFTTLEEPIASLGIRHMMLMSASWLLYLAAFMSRTAHMLLVDHLPGISYFFSIAGFLVMAWGGWCGGQLVYAHGAGYVKRNPGVSSPASTNHGRSPSGTS